MSGGIAETKTVVAGSRLLKIKTSDAQIVSIFDSVTYLCEKILPSEKVYSSIVLKRNVEKGLRANCLCEITSECQQDSRVLRLISQLVKFALEIYHPDGFKVIYPYVYKLHEPTLRLYHDSLGYHPVLEIKALEGATNDCQTHLRIGSWNTQGGATPARRSTIDFHCAAFNLDIVCLQDVRAQVTDLVTENYLWFTTYTSDTRERVSGFMLRKKLTCLVQLQVLASGLQILMIEVEGRELIVINAYWPCNGQPGTFESYCELRNLISAAIQEHPGVMCLVCGDFNARLGRDDNHGDSALTGEFLLHGDSNENGCFLWELMQHHQFSSCTTTHSSTTLVTRQQGGSSSQLDHILVSKELTYLLSSVQGSWRNISDHKLLTVSVRVPVNRGHSDIEMTRPADLIKRRPQYNLELLKEEDVVKRFDMFLKERCEAEQVKRKSRVSVTEAWDDFTAIVNQISHELLNQPVQRSPEEKLARRRYLESIKLLQRSRIVDQNSLYNPLSDYPQRDPMILQLMGDRRRQYRQACVRQQHKVLHDGLSIIQGSSRYSTKVNATFKMIRGLRQKPSPNTVPIPLSVLNAELQQLNRGKVQQVPADDHFPSTRPPDASCIKLLIDNLKCKTAPGLDHIYNEMLKASTELRLWIGHFIQLVYERNEVPQAWQRTSIFLLPKKQKPTSYDDMRPITLCSSAYKLYARLLLDELHKYLPKMPDYQSGFLRNRSADDNIYYISRIAETQWNHAQPLYILALDLKKAFSLISVHRLPAILLVFGVPAFLVNRIIEACLYEKTMINYMGQQTPFYEKTLGVKQGCPISPELFIWIFHYAVLKIQTQLRQLQKPIELYIGEKEKELALPALSSYADDMTLLTSRYRDMKNIFPIVQEALEECGLEINPQKSALMAKSRLLQGMSGEVTLGTLKIPLKKKIVVLGTCINNDMNRRNMLLDRCNKAVRMYHCLIGNLSHQKLSFKVWVRIYQAVLVPMMLYGLRAIALTKEMKLLLMRREIVMIRGLAQVSHPKPKNEKITKILKGRTINRVLTVGRVSYYSHLQRKPVDSLLRRAGNYRLKGRRKIGRPCFSHLVSFEKELLALGPDISRAEWDRAFASATLTKKLGERIYDLVRTAVDPMPSDLGLYAGND